jgi:hypothetical protein
MFGLLEVQLLWGLRSHCADAKAGFSVPVRTVESDAGDAAKGIQEMQSAAGLRLGKVARKTHISQCTPVRRGMLGRTS